MKISTQTLDFTRRFGLFEGVRRLAGIGYDALDFSLCDLWQIDDPKALFNDPDYVRITERIRCIAEAQGVPFHQAHAPFPSYRLGDDAYNRAAYPAICRSIQIAGTLGAKQIVVHPIHLPENQKQFNLDFYNSLIPICAESGVKIALENMWKYEDEPHCTRIVGNVCSTSEEFAEYLDALDPAHFTACLDLGHAGLVGQTAQDMIRKLGHDRLHALHVHDNDNQRDLHTLPYLGKLDWAGILRALNEISYDGYFNYEADFFLARFPDALVEDAATFMLQVARYLTHLN